MAGEKAYDAIIVGAGPSGCSTALFLAKQGRKVLILDKAVFPREKVCGDAFSGKSLGIARELGLLPEIEKRRHAIIRGVAIIAPNGKQVDIPFPNAEGMNLPGYTIARIDTDDILFQAAHAHKNIQTYQNFTVAGLLKNGQGAVCGVGGTFSPQKSAMNFKARVVVGADGAASAVSRLLRLPSNPPEHVYSAIRGYWNGVEGLAENIELYFIDGVLPGYLWIFPMGGGRANVGLGILSSDLIKKKKHPNAILQEAMQKHPAIAGRFKNAVLDGKIGTWAIPIGSCKKQCIGDGWLLVGDAASLVDPFTGEGVGNALCSGSYAATTIDGALGKTEGSAPLSAASLAPYGDLLDSHIRPELRNSYRMQRMCRFRFLLNMLIGKAATKPEVRQAMIDMIASDEEKKKVESPLFYLKLFLT